MAEDTVVALQRPTVPSLPEGACLGRIVRLDEEGIWVESDEHDAGPMLAMSVVALGRDELEAAIAEQRDAVLLFIASSGQPVLLGLRQAVPVLEVQLPAQELTASVDGREGKKVRLEGQDEVVLRCGKASITLRKNGRIVIRGVQVESRATGRNRIKGGAVLIN